MQPQNQNKDRAVRRKPSLDLSTMVYGKVPPQAKELEEAILGGMMLEKGAVDRAIEFIKPESFYVEAHQLIFKAILDLHGKGWPIDILTVTELLREKGELEMVGGPYYVTKLTNAVVSSANIEFHSKIIAQYHMKRELIRIGGELIAGGYEDMTDVQDLLDEHEKSMTMITTQRSGDNVQGIDAGLVKMIQRVESLRMSKKDITGVTSGYQSLDRITYGWQNTDLIILAARPAVGKTAFALNIARNAAKAAEPTPVAFFSLEMSTEQLVMRIGAAESEIWLEKIARGKMEEFEMKQLYTKGVQALAKAPIFIDDTPALNIFELRAKCRRLKNKHDIGLVIIDYLQLMSGINESRGNREQEISQISRNLKGLAKELNIPIIALSQLSRKVEDRKGDKMPQLSDLRESGAIEQDADMVMFMYRPEYYDQNSNEMGESTKGLTLIDIAKHRNGVLARGNEAVKLRALLHIQKFVEWQDDIVTSLKPIGGNWRPVAQDDDEAF